MILGKERQMGDHWFTLLVCVVFGSIALYRLAKAWRHVRKDNGLTEEEIKSWPTEPRLARLATQTAEVVIHFLSVPKYDGENKDTIPKNSFRIPPDDRCMTEEDVDFYRENEFKSEAIPENHPAPIYEKTKQIIEGGVGSMPHLRLRSRYQTRGIWILVAKKEFNQITKYVGNDCVIPPSPWIIHVGFDVARQAGSNHLRIYTSFVEIM